MGGLPRKLPLGQSANVPDPSGHPPSAYRVYDVITLREVNLRKNLVDFEQ
jgi:hypothetical protein